MSGNRPARTHERGFAQRDPPAVLDAPRRVGARLTANTTEAPAEDPAHPSHCSRPGDQPVTDGLGEDRVHVDGAAR
jgi:hypothetical protein